VSPNPIPSFAYDGTVLASPELSAAARTVLGIEKAPEPLDLGRLRQVGGLRAKPGERSVREALPEAAFEP
jgi:hypothetical protein